MKKIKINPSITDRSNSLKIYLRDIKKNNLLTIEEEIKLCRLIQEGNKDALDKLICANTRFVVSVAKAMRFENASLSELISLGNLGLIEAARKFDSSMGFRFISFAVWHIKREMYNYFLSKNPIRIPQNQKITLAKINKLSAEFEQKNHRSPTIEEVVLLTGFKLEQVLDAMSSAISVVSIDESIKGDESLTLIDKLKNENSPAADEIVQNEATSKDIEQLLSILSKRDKSIVAMFFGLNGHTRMTLKEISITVNLSKERTRQIKDFSIKKMEKSIHNKRLRSDYL